MDFTIVLKAERYLFVSTPSVASPVLSGCYEIWRLAEPWTFAKFNDEITVFDGKLYLK